MKILNRFTGELILEIGTLVEANLSEADLSKVNFYKANLYGADLRNADLYRADLYGANLHGTNLHGTNLHGANLHEANLYEANLSGANLYRANLYGAVGVVCISWKGFSLCIQNNMAKIGCRYLPIKEFLALDFESAVKIGCEDDTRYFEAYKILLTAGQKALNLISSE